MHISGHGDSQYSQFFCLGSRPKPPRSAASTINLEFSLSILCPKTSLGSAFRREGVRSVCQVETWSPRDVTKRRWEGPKSADSKAHAGGRSLVRAAHRGCLLSREYRNSCDLSFG